MKKQIKVMLSLVLHGFLYAKKPISILRMLIFIILLSLGGVTKYGAIMKRELNINKNIQ